jgi:serine/threonine-protein kinase
MSAEGAKGTPLFGVPGVGARIGRHRIDGILGRGGMGVVLAARHETLGDRVAIKVLVAHAWETAEAEARFVREAQICAQLKSDHALRVFDVGRLDDESGAPYLVMEYLDGKNLEELVLPKGQAAKPFGVMETADNILEACEVLAEAHAQGVVHRDLKPSNLFLTKRPDGSPLLKVLDFGIAKRAEANGNLTATSAVIGTPNFMSPEQLRATRDVDLRSDVWSLGATLYALLTAKAPFEGTSAAETTVNVLTAAPVPVCVRRRDLPPEMDRIVLTCLEKDPAHRFASMRALADALVAFASPRGRAAHTTLLRRAYGAKANPLAATAYAGTVRIGEGQVFPQVMSGPSRPMHAPPPGSAPPITGAPYNYPGADGTFPEARRDAGESAWAGGPSVAHTGQGGWAPTGPVPAPGSNGLVLGGAIAGIGLVAAGIVLAVVLHFRGSVPVPAAPAPSGDVAKPPPSGPATLAPGEPPPLAPLAPKPEGVPTVGKTPEKSDKSAVPPTVAPPLVLPTPPPPSAIPTVAASALPKVPPSKPKADDLFNAN